MDLAVSLPAGSELPLYRQITEALRSAIMTGRVKPGEKLPSSRALADSMEVARDTVSRSYAELASQGYIKIIAGSGVIVNPDCPLLSSATERRQDGDETLRAELSLPPLRLSSYGQRIMDSGALATIAPFIEPEFNFDAPRLSELPINRWREVLHKSSRLQDAALLSYVNDPFGYPPLREAIAAYLARCRSIQCSKDQTAVFTTTEGGTDLVCRVLLEQGDSVAVENPGSPAVRLTFGSHGVNMVPIPVDGNGLDVGALYRCSERVKLVYLTPSHHDPTGVVLSHERRLDLLKWAKGTGAMILEDDFDSEYRYGERPVPALKGLDDGDSVIYRYNFWRALFPLARIAFLVLPHRLAPAVWRAKSLTERDVSMIEQRALAEMISDGHLERHIRRTRSLYAKRRASLVQALTRYLRTKVTISEVSAGMHLLVRFTPDLDEAHILSSAKSAHLPVVSTRENYVGDPATNEFKIAFAHLDEHQFAPLVLQFAKALTGR